MAHAVTNCDGCKTALGAAGCPIHRSQIQTRTAGPPPWFYVVNLPARCDCGLVWTFTFDSARGAHSILCPRCGAGLEVRSYGPPERARAAVGTAPPIGDRATLTVKHSVKHRKRGTASVRGGSGWR